MQQLNIFGEEEIIKENPKEEVKVEFKIVTEEELPNLKLTIRQVKLLIDSLIIYKKYVQSSRGNELRKKIELVMVNDLFEFLQQVCNLNYEKACNKCINKMARKLKEDDPGAETFSWLGNKQNEKK